MSDAASNPTIVALLITNAATILVAFLTNWDKIFKKKDEVKASFTGYSPTGDFETELRYYMEVAGMRKMVNGMQDGALVNVLSKLSPVDPNRGEIENIFRQEMPNADQIVTMLLPIFQKYFSVAQLQEMNKFYSTPIMREMVQKAPFLVQDFMPIQLQLAQIVDARVQARLDALPRGPANSQHAQA